MRNVFILVLSIFVLFQITTAPALGSKKSAEEKRQGLLKRNEQILAALYKLQPDAKNAIKNAYGYATFSDFGLKILVFGGGSGHGVAIVNSTGQKTFMRMLEIQAGLGFGIKKFMLVWVFDNKKVFDSFVNSGWTFGGQATAAAKDGKKGGAMQGAFQVAPGISLYQMTAQGLALELTLKGSKYSKDGKLNSKDEDKEKDKVPQKP
ncbi:MAG: YSC84-related protein [Candidatus Xenobiia bacterium LiM19]